ncbi:hypothetical protein GN958_ATG02494 [Phytophthora infestans]|uniref:Secreted protein n=1 Tax=Phytophthora infestans TaxID=4787 RepID=A0A8S9V847_PHYIN|nr:hypothetical protein GN958_ATG02494 [Phytophthora infestans]
MELLLLLHELLGGAVTATEAALLLSFEQPERPIIPEVRFCVTTLSGEDCRQQFRFDVAGVIRLTELFALPEFVTRARAIRRTPLRQCASCSIA